MKYRMLRGQTKRLAMGAIIFVTVAMVWADGNGSFASGRIRNSARTCSFDSPQSLGPLINSPLFEGGPTVSADERTLIFTATRDPITQQEDLFISQRATPDDPWGTPEPLPATVNDPIASEFSPRLSHDGKSLYFGSNRTGGFGAADIYVSTRESPAHLWSPAPPFDGARR